MANQTTPFEIDASRLTQYFRIRWCIPLAILLAVVVIPMLLDGDPASPSILVALGILVAAIIAALIVAPWYVESLDYWIEGTTLRINQGIVVRKSKSIPLDRVSDIELVQGPLMRMCGIWSLRIQTAGSTQQSPEGTIWGARHPESVRDTIVKIRDQAACHTDSGT